MKSHNITGKELKSVKASIDSKLKIADGCHCRKREGRQFTACTARSTLYILKIEDTRLVTFYDYNLQKVYFFISRDPFLFDLIALDS
jgi:hypothetical protein